MTTTQGPTALPVLPDAIPDILRDRDTWVLWRKKVPINPRTGRNASPTNPAHWTDFATALAAHESGRFRSDGIGVVLTGDGITFLDFDKCVAADGTIDPSVVADLAGLGTYAELSPSGTGIHAFVLADLPPGGNKRDRFEAYDRARYATVTGHRLPDAPDGIAADADALAEWHARRIGAPEQNRASERPASATTRGVAAVPAAWVSVDDDEIIRRCRIRYRDFERLYRDGTDGDQSGADYAVVAAMVYAGADPAQIDRLIRQSALMRDKWNRADYRERTIAAAFDRERQRWTDPATVTLGGNADAPDATLADALPDDPAALRALVIDLATERDRLHADRERMRAERDMANGTIRSVTAILGNGKLGAARVTGAATVVALQSRTDDATTPDDGMHRVSLAEIGERVGIDPATAGRHLKRIAALPDSPLRHDVRPSTELRPVLDAAGHPVRDEAGAVVMRWQRRNQTFIGMTTATVLDFAESVARLADPGNEQGNRHGGVRRRTIPMPVIPACPDHPEAGADVRVVAVCAEPGCGTILAAADLHVAAPDLEAVIDADCILQSAQDDLSGNVVVTTTRQDAIGSGGTDADTEPEPDGDDADGADCIMQPDRLTVRAPRTATPAYGQNRERRQRDGALLGRIAADLGIRTDADPDAMAATDFDALGRNAPDTPEQAERDRIEAERERRELAARVTGTVHAATADVPDQTDGTLPLPLSRSERADLAAS